MERANCEFERSELHFYHQHKAMGEQERLHFEALLGPLFIADRDLAHLINGIAGMASLDGAVLVSADLEVLGFGARVPIDAKIADGEVDRVEFSRGQLFTHKQPLNSFGMRHLSGFEFVSTGEGAMAFILSEDGGIRVFVNTGERILLYDCLELTEYVVSSLPTLDGKEQPSPMASFCAKVMSIFSTTTNKGSSTEQSDEPKSR